MVVVKSNINWFVIGVFIVVVVVLVVIGGFVVFFNNQVMLFGVIFKVNDIFNFEIGVIIFGDGEDMVVVFVDFQCLICNSFEQQFGVQLEVVVVDGCIMFEYYFIVIFDCYFQGIEYFLCLVGVVVCVVELNFDLYFDYVKVFFENQFEENFFGLIIDQFVDFVMQVGVDDVVFCIIDEMYCKFGVVQVKQYEIGGMFMIDINGEWLNLQDQVDMKKFIDFIS